ncbi:FAD-dependent monooxygenase [Occultella aeris]|uniref:6-hydroxynicotinate 3-monooxygenase n=1 Tax=Occultella aeris TaxID=2761496 RepID=A0A7M4DRY2_9MICO|nr:FAD-dependent monooxygenase [Occultella aeris]VZO40226.1 6-hydroxynicotinate 3-monooxygenase precursor [Occultella aeris]
MAHNILISGAGIAGSVLAYWLAERGFNPTVVEKRPHLRQTGGHAVDLAGVSIEVIERMGILPAVSDAHVRHDRMVFHQRRGRPIEMPRLTATLADRHVEIQRDALVELLHGAAGPHAEYIFGDTITAITDGPDAVTVEFESSAPRAFDLVLGADGLHSMVRRLVFGPEDAYRHDLGAYLSVYSYPNTVGLGSEVVGYFDVDRAAFTYPVDDGRLARALLLFRGGPMGDLRDPARQMRTVRDAFAGIESHLPFPIDELHQSEDFYFDSISQIQMNTWSKGRVSLVGDAAYSPGPAVGGGTAMAVLGAYVLANELALARDDHTAAFASTEAVMGPAVAQSRKVGPSSLRQLVPGNRLTAWLTPRSLRLLVRLPRPVALALFSLQGSDTSRLDDFSSERLPLG